jgi:hypothetical protein
MHIRGRYDTIEARQAEDDSAHGILRIVAPIGKRNIHVMPHLENSADGASIEADWSDQELPLRHHHQEIEE